MKIWIHLNGVQEGPYDVDNLPLDRMTIKTPVWYDGLEYWRDADQAPVVADILFRKEQEIERDELDPIQHVFGVRDEPAPESDAIDSAVEPIAFGTAVSGIDDEPSPEPDPATEVQKVVAEVNDVTLDVIDEIRPAVNLDDDVTPDDVTPDDVTSDDVTTDDVDHSPKQPAIESEQPDRNNLEPWPAQQPWTPQAAEQPLAPFDEPQPVRQAFVNEYNPAFTDNAADRQIPAAPAPKRPPHYLVWSILLTLLCCNPIGVISIGCGYSVISKFNNYDYDGAVQASNTTEWWLAITIVTSLIWLAFSPAFLL